MFAKHIARIGNKTFCFSIWNLDKMVPTNIVVGAKSKARRSYNACAFDDIDLLAFTNFEIVDAKNKPVMFGETQLTGRKKRGSLSIEEKEKANKIVNFLIEQ
tara:strand:- start:543 stop:848 length:306 start_codon:yes stop_codon:yes gene_type:complete